MAIKELKAALGVTTLALFGPRAREERTGPYLLGDRAMVMRPTRDGVSLPCKELAGTTVAESFFDLLEAADGSARRS